LETECTYFAERPGLKNSATVGGIARTDDEAGSSSFYVCFNQATFDSGINSTNTKYDKEQLIRKIVDCATTELKCRDERDDSARTIYRRLVETEDDKTWDVTLQFPMVAPFDKKSRGVLWRARGGQGW